MKQPVEYPRQFPQIICFSFTFVILINACLNLGMVYATYTSYDILKTFVMVVGVSVLMYMTDKLNIKNTLLSIAVDVLDVLVAVFVLGALLQVFEFNAITIFVVFSTSILVYFCVYFFIIITTVKSANNINKKLKRIHDKNQKEKQDSK